MNETEDFILRKLRHFNVYDIETKKLKYCKFNFNFDLYASDFNLVNKSKLDIFDHFLKENEWDPVKESKVKDELVKYFTPMTPEILNYHGNYGCTIHSGYMTIQGLNTFVSNVDLVNNQFDLIFYTDNQIRRLQDYFYNDNFDNIYSKYNFNFYEYTQEFKVFGNKLVVFTDFISRVIYSSMNIRGSRGYGDPNVFRKFFIQSINLRNYLIEHGCSSIFNNSRKNINNIDYVDYAELENLDPTNIELTKEYYIRDGQFKQLPIKFLYPELNKYQKITSSVAYIKSGLVGAGFLYKDSLYPKNIYCVSCNHLLDSENLETFKSSFEIFDYTNNIISQTAEFKIIGRDIFTDIVVGLYDPELSYNKVYNVDLSEFEPLTINSESILKIGDEIDLVGHIGELDNRAFLTGKMMDPRFSGCFFKDAFLVPESLLIDINIMKGLSGSPMFYNDGSKLSVVGMVIARLGSDNQYCLGISAFTLQSTIKKIIENYQVYFNLYKNDLVQLGFWTKNSITKKWLGLNGYYYDPIIKKGSSALNNLPYVGGLVIDKFVLGFNYLTASYIYDTQSLGKMGIMKIDSPLLNTNMYRRFIDSGKVPIVIKAITLYDGFKGVYSKYFIGKYSNQVGFHVYSYGLLPISNFPIEDTTSSNKIGYTYGKIIIEYYYYDGKNWQLEEEKIGGTTKEWYNTYLDSNGNKYYQHKFEFPTILTSYQESFAKFLFNYKINKFAGNIAGVPTSILGNDPGPLVVRENYSGSLTEQGMDEIPLVGNNSSPIRTYGNKSILD